MLSQNELNREVAAATGESVGTVRRLGFSPLPREPHEQDREPLVVDWDALDAQRRMLHPVG